MRTEVSIPNELFDTVEGLAEREQEPRSAVYSAALREHEACQAPNEITDAMNRTCDQVGAVPDEFVAGAARRVLERVEW